MIFPSEMSRISILTHDRHSDALVELLHEAGLMEISLASLEDLEEGAMHPDVGRCASYELRLTRIIDILKKYERKKKGIRAALSPSITEKAKIKKRLLEEKIRQAKNLLEGIESFIIEAESKIEGIEKRLGALKEDIVKMESLSPFDVDLSWIGKSRYLTIKAGISRDVNALKESLRGIDVNVFSKQIVNEKEEWAVLLVAYASCEEEISSKIKNFDEIEVSGKGSPSDVINKLKKEKKELEKKKKKLIHSLREIYKKRKFAIFAIREEIQLEKQRKEIPERFGKTMYTSLIEGWCLAQDKEKLKKLVDKATYGEASFSCRKVERNTDEAPIHLEMPKWANSFRTFLELFALPKYNEINPSVFLGISFILFFAIMLGDAGYGSMILLASVAAYFKLGKHSEMIKNWSFLGIWLGISTIITGLLFNGFFGDFIPRFIYGDANKTLYNLQIMGHQLPIDALHKPLAILVLTLLIGLAHLNIGFILAMYQNYKRGHLKAIFEEQIPWFLLQIGGGALIGKHLLHIWDLPYLTWNIAILFTAIALIVLLASKGPMGFFDVTGFIGDWLSYARLLALGLATAGMALAFNIVAQLAPSIVPYVGVVLLPLILIVAHIANLLIQALGAAIHSLRLQYVEFFGRFYEGGGRKFVPFHIKRRYTEEIK
ncbi:MAG: V-type ATP synthase subunit I [Candidatus Thermoplasmatota archaeon]|nr:V-type ATP synthase subunit I [Candidatus Thermoplasmatota archaeon]